MWAEILRNMDIKMHKLANKSLFGTPISIIEGASAIVELIPARALPRTKNLPLVRSVKSRA